MLKHEVQKILHELFEQTHFVKIRIKEANDPVYGEIDPKTEDIITESLRDEFDISIEDSEISQADLGGIARLLKPYPHIQMRIRNGILEIYSTNIAPDDQKKGEA